MTTIIGIKLENRVANSTELQKKLTEYGCIIKTRLGLHEVSDGQCPTNGIILLEVVNEEKTKQMIEELYKIENIKIGTMEL